MSTATTSPAAKGRGKNSKGTNGNGHATAGDGIGIQTVGATQRQASSEDIARRAYELYEEEGRQDGRDVEYWLRAEAELTGRGG
jgi:hypothetical protein